MGVTGQKDMTFSGPRPSYWGRVAWVLVLSFLSLVAVITFGRVLRDVQRYYGYPEHIMGLSVSMRKSVAPALMLEVRKNAAMFLGSLICLLVAAARRDKITTIVLGCVLAACSFGSFMRLIRAAALLAGGEGAMLASFGEEVWVWGDVSLHFIREIIAYALALMFCMSLLWLLAFECRLEGRGLLDWFLRWGGRKG